jgi:type VI protein secretion system component Hcp
MLDEHDRAMDKFQATPNSIEDLEPTDETAVEVTGGFTITKLQDKATPFLYHDAVVGNS